jgi:MmyB-like transcription regulator ligand binding domain/Helix-turn-helix domain
VGGFVLPGYNRTPLAGLARRTVGRVSPKSTEVRDFLVTRRAMFTPDQAGLRHYGANRRVPGLRREEVALLAGVSADYYTRLEKGNLAGVSDSVLDPAARDYFPDYDKSCHTSVAILRTEAGRDPHNRDLTDLVGELCTRSEDFRN